MRRVYTFERLLKRQNWRCCWCGESLTLETCTLEHIIPLSLGGANAFDNYAVSHKPCNLGRSSDMTRAPHPSFLFEFVRHKLSSAMTKPANGDT